ncbi:MAG: hypothetical protein QOE20_4769 [Mycobacterium sp.]|nr:hypothetical protein [Mycobacterium sp.]
MRTPSALGSRGNQLASNVEESAPLHGGRAQRRTNLIGITGVSVGPIDG